MSVKIEKVASDLELAEGPHWDVRSQKLFYVDLLKGKIFRFDPKTNKTTMAHMSK